MEGAVGTGGFDEELTEGTGPEVVVEVRGMDDLFRLGGPLATSTIARKKKSNWEQEG